MEAENFDARIVQRFGKYAIIGPYDSRGINNMFSVYRTETESGPITGAALGEFAEQDAAELFAEMMFEQDDNSRLEKARDKCDDE